MLLVLTGCEAPDLDAKFDNYLTRLGTTLEVKTFPPPPTEAPRPPRTARLQIKIPGDSVDTLDFMALTGCAVQVTIGKRNSSLGLMARPSQKLLLELEYLRLAPDCVKHLRANNQEQLATTLEQSWELKRTHIPQLIFNATLASEEFRAFWRASPIPGEYPPVSSSVVIAALGSINHDAKRWMNGDYRADNREFELRLSEIAGGDAGAVLQSLARQKDWLTEANRLLEERLEQGPLCAPGVRHEAADILPTVVRKYFIGDLQPGAAQMERRIYELLPAVTKLEETLANALAPAYLKWQAARNDLLQRARSAPARHVSRLQQAQADCAAP